MAQGNRYARDSVPAPFEGYPAYGAVHEILPDAHFRNFLTDVSQIADNVFMETLKDDDIEVNPIPDYVADETFERECLGPERDTTPKIYDPRKFYKIFDPDKMGATVLEMDPAQKIARTLRKVFQSNDFGMIEQEARNEIDRRQPLLYPQLTFRRVEGVGRRLPGVRKADVRQKLSLIADSTLDFPTRELMTFEQEVLIKALKKRFKQNIDTWTLLPHLTFTVLKAPVTDAQFVFITEQINEKLSQQPLQVALDRKLTIRTKSVRN